MHTDKDKRVIQKALRDSLVQSVMEESTNRLVRLNPTAKNYNECERSAYCELVLRLIDLKIISVNHDK